MNGNHDPHLTTRTWDMMVRTHDEPVHLTRTADPAARTSTTVLLDRLPLVEGGEPVLRDALLVLTTINRGEAYESMVGVVVRKQYNARTVLIMPISLTVLATREDHLTSEGLRQFHEEALSVLAARFHDDSDFRNRLTVPA